jgi:hypothetical protein
MVASIPDVIPPPKPGPLEAIDEVRENKIYKIRFPLQLITIMEI